MTGLASDLDPLTVRRDLEIQREMGTGWDLAWQRATGHRMPSTDSRSVYAFMYKHFRAAYLNNSQPEGRCMVPERDTSRAVTMTRASLPIARTKSERCRSGDGCDRLATRGRFGTLWCEFHGAELERLAAGLADGKMERQRPSGPVPKAA